MVAVIADLVGLAQLMIRLLRKFETACSRCDTRLQLRLSRVSATGIDWNGWTQVLIRQD